MKMIINRSIKLLKTLENYRIGILMVVFCSIFPYASYGQVKSPSTKSLVIERIFDSNDIDTVRSRVRDTDAIRKKSEAQFDSLQRPIGKTKALISDTLRGVQAKIDSIMDYQPAVIQRSIDKLDTIQNRINSKVDSATAKINSKLSGFSENGGNIPGGVAIPELDIKSKLPPLGSELPTDDLNKITSLPSAELPKTDLGAMTAIPEMKIPGIEEGSSLPGEISEKLNDVSEAGEQIGGYKEEFQKIQEGDLTDLEKIPGDIESRVGELDEIQAFQEEAKKFEAIKKNWNDPAVMKEEALTKAKEYALNHFAGHQKELVAVMQKMSTLKSKIPDPEGVIDLYAKRQKFFKDKPIIERFVPGIAFQFQKQESVWLDINPYLGFKISGRFVGGVGWNQRIAYNFDEWFWDKNYRIHGPRTFVHFKLNSTLTLKAEAEVMTTPVKGKGFNSSSEIIGRQWVRSYFAGVKKDFQFSKQLKGNVQMLYNLYNPERESPYITKLNIRMGFELPLMKAVKVQH